MKRFEKSWCDKSGKRERYSKPRSKNTAARSKAPRATFKRRHGWVKHAEDEDTYSLRHCYRCGRYPHTYKELRVERAHSGKGCQPGPLEADR